MLNEIVPDNDAPVKSTVMFSAADGALSAASGSAAYAATTCACPSISAILVISAVRVFTL